MDPNELTPKHLMDLALSHQVLLATLRPLTPLRIVSSQTSWVLKKMNKQHCEKEKKENHKEV